MARAVTIHERGSENALFAETSLAMANLSLDDPRLFSVADLREHNRRRWRALTDVPEVGLVESMFAAQFDQHGDSRYATFLVTSAFVHAVLGRTVTSFEYRGRVWDPHPENLYVRTDQDFGFDWVGVQQTTVRVLPDDSWAQKQLSAVEMQVLPGEKAMAYWLAGRVVSGLSAAFEVLGEVSHCFQEHMWATAGREVAFSAAATSRLGNVCRENADRRAQLVLSALVDLGVPARGSRPLPSSLMYSRNSYEDPW